MTNQRTDGQILEDEAHEAYKEKKNNVHFLCVYDPPTN